MNEEEKKAVEDSKDLIKVFNNHKDKDFIDRLYYKNKPIEENLKILLNLIEKLQKENEGQKCLIETQSHNEEVYEKLVNRLQKENKELKLYNNSITSQLEQMTTEKFKNGWFHQSEFKGLIPVQKVKDKIEEYKNMLKTCNKAKDIDRIKAINERILELQELLEGRK